METRTAQVIDALIALSAAITGYRLADEYTGPDPSWVTVWDGPAIRGQDDNSDGAGHLIIGYSGDDPEALQPAAQTTIGPGPMASTVRPRDEVGTIVCRAVFDCADTPKQARDAALAILTAVANLCRSDPTLGINASATVGGVIVRCWVTAGTLLQYQVNGYTAEWEFTVTFKTRV